MNVSDRIFELIKAAGVDTVFYVPGGGAMYLVDALGRSGLRAVSMLHEQGAGYAALGYARAHGLGVCLTTAGPGATNAITPCAAAWYDSVPVLFISGQCSTDTASTGQRGRGQQEVDIVSIVDPITKIGFQLNMSTGVEMLANHIIKLTTSGRPGPCWLSVPVDVQAMEVV